MAIEFSCACGKKLSVPDDAAGRRAKCPSCGTVVNVPGTPPPPPPAGAPTTSKVDQMVDRLSIDLAESQERAPQLTRLALGIGALALVTFFLTFFVFIEGLVIWVLIWLPMCAAGVLMAVGMIQADHRTPRFIQTAAPLIVGTSWGILWLSAVPHWRQEAAPFTTLIALANVAGYAFLYWYIGRPWMAVFFQEDVQIAEIKEGNSSQPAEGSNKK